jgi:DNA invertase Pin-like site-specific DNA recombinase
MPSTNGHGAGEATERIALSLRVSSEEQRDRETIEIQDKFLDEYCRLYGLEVAGVYPDDGVSGTIPLHERPEGRGLLEDAKASVARHDELIRLWAAGNAGGAAALASDIFHSLLTTEA